MSTLIIIGGALLLETIADAIPYRRRRHRKRRSFGYAPGGLVTCR